jgi:hypothetical protein
MKILIVIENGKVLEVRHDMRTLLVEAVVFDAGGMAGMSPQALTDARMELRRDFPEVAVPIV